jgi:hypothetical protein
MADGVLGNCFDDFRLARVLERGELAAFVLGLKANLTAHGPLCEHDQGCAATSHPKSTAG